MERYETYKDSRVGWVEEIPTSWDEMPVKRVCDVVLGKMLCSEDKGGYHEKPYLRAKNVMWLKVDQDDIKKMWFSSNELSQYRLEAGDLLVSEGGEVGRTCIWNNEIGECYIQNSVHRVRFRTDKDSRYYLYLFYCLGKIGVFDAIVNRISIAHLTKEKLQQVLILKPRYSQQTAIANFLDRKTAEIDALIAQKERLLELYEEEKTAIINHAVTKGLDPNAELKDSGVEWLGEIPVGWEIKKLKYGVSKVGSGVTPRGGASIYQLSGIPLLRSQNIHVDGIKMDDVAYIDEELHDSMSNSKVQAGDVLLNITGASIGRCFYVEENFGEANVNQHVCIIRPNGKIKTSYLYFVLRSDLGEEQIKIEQTGSGREGLNFEALNNFIIPYLSVEEQTALANFLDRKMTEIDTKIAKTQRIIELQKEYRTALISDVVTGKIKVSHLAGEEAAR